MGYTHYWTQHRAFSDAEWADVQQTYGTLLQEAVRNKIGISLDPSETQASAHALLEVTSTPPANFKIFLNGVGEDESHETFVITQHNTGSDFCKTAYKPYDTVVTAILAALETLYPAVISVSSDGDAVDWEKGVGMATKCLGKNISIPKRLLESEDDENY